MDLDDAIGRAAHVAREVLLPASDETDQTGTWPAAGITALRAAELGGLVVPRSLGGSGHGFFGVARVCEVLGRGCASTSMAFGMHLVGSAVLAAKPTAEQRRRYLEPIATGEHLTTLALSEPGTGSHFYLPQARLEPEGDGFRLSGTKAFVTNGGAADSYVVSATSGKGPTAGEFSCVMVRRDAPGLSWGPRWSGWGMRGNSSRTASFERVLVERSDLLGREGDEIWYMFHVVLPWFLVAMAGTYLGVVAAALDEGRAHVVQRRYEHVGSTLALNALVQNQVGALWGAVQRSRALLYEAAKMADAGASDALPALCSAKAEIADTGERVVAKLMTLMGGRGYAQDHRIHRLYRDIRAAQVMAPTSEMLRTWTGRAWLGVPLLGD